MKKRIESNRKVLEAKYGSPDRPLIINGIEIPCYVLEDGKRVLTQTGLIQALGMSRGSAGGGDRLVSFISQKRINPLISNELRNAIEMPLSFNMASGGKSALAYEATILVDICDSIILANKKKPLQKQQQHIVEQAEILIRAFAKTGIIALIDEVTGYQNERDKDALQQFLQKFLEEERGKWVATFPDTFFEAIFKMKGWNWSIANAGKKPQVVGHYINNYVYSRIAPKVLSELRKLNPKGESGRRKGTHTQWIDIDYGHPKLKEHLNILTVLAKASGYNWTNWDRMVERSLPKFEQDGSQIQEIPFDDV